MNNGKNIIVLIVLAAFIGGIILLIVKLRPIKETYYDINGKKMAELHFKNKKLSSAYKIVKYHLNGNVKEIAEIGADSSISYEGWRIFFYENGNIKLKSQYKNDKLNGYSYWYDSNGSQLQKGFRLDDKDYGNTYFFKGDWIKLYNAVDFLGHVFYVVQYDSSGGIKEQDGIVFSPVFVRSIKETKSYSLWNDSVMVNEPVNLLITIAEPPNTITTIGIKEDKGGPALITNLPAADCSAFLSKVFTKPGKYDLIIYGAISDKKTGNLIKKDSLAKSIVVL